MTTPKERAAASLSDPLAMLLLALTFSTGLVDAVSFLGLGNVFTANMTGNVVLFGFGLAGGFDLPILAPLVSLAAFFAGSAMGGALANHSGAAADHRHQVRVALAIEVALLAAAALIAVFIDVVPGEVSAGVLIGMLGGAMGVRNATVRSIGIPDMTTTVVTMTITGLAADLRALGGKGGGERRRVAVVAAMLAGAIVGALLVRESLELGLASAAALSGISAALYVRNTMTPR